MIFEGHHFASDLLCAIIDVVQFCLKLIRLEYRRKRFVEMKLSIASALVRRYAIEIAGTYSGSIANPRHFIAAVLWMPFFVKRNNIGKMVKCSLELSTDIRHELLQIPGMLTENSICLNDINAFLNTDLATKSCHNFSRDGVMLSVSARKMLEIAAEQSGALGYDRIYVPHLYYAAVQTGGEQWLKVFGSTIKSNPSVFDRLYDLMAAGGNSGIGSLPVKVR